MEAAFAGALGVRLGGPLAYDGRVEGRPALGDGRPPGPRRRAARGAPVARGRRAAAGACALLRELRAMKGALLVCGTHSDAGK